MLRSLWKKVLLFALLPATVFAANQNMVQTGNGYDIQYPLVYLAANVNVRMSNFDGLRM